MTYHFQFLKHLSFQIIKKQSYAGYYGNIEDAFCIPISYVRINLRAAVYICLPDLFTIHVIPSSQFKDQFYNVSIAQPFRMLNRNLI